MWSYLRESVSRLKKDLLAKFFYDILKWIFVSLILLIAARYFGAFQVSNFLTSSYSLTLFEISLVVICSIVATVILLRALFQRRYRALEKDNNTDELTGLKNHKALKKELAIKIDAASKSEDSLAIVILDVDDFKAFNTRFGYTIADKVLAKIGLVLSNDRRITDEIFRQFQRGDEFIIVATGTTASEAFQAAERKRHHIANTNFTVNEMAFQLTVSCGVTEYIDGDTYESFTERASSALMKAKATPLKNCTITFV